MITMTREEAPSSTLSKLQTLIAHASILPQPGRATALAIAELYDADLDGTYITVEDLAKRMGVRVSTAEAMLDLLMATEEWSSNEDRTLLKPNWRVLEAQRSSRIDYLALRDTFSPDFDDDPWNDKGWVEGEGF